MPTRATRFTLRDNQIPTAWFNVVPSMPNPPSPPLHPGTKQPIGPADLAPLFPMALIEQEVSTAEWIDILRKAGFEVRIKRREDADFWYDGRR